MKDSSGHPFLRPGRLNTYTAYSIGSFIAWAVIWAIFAATAKNETLGYVLMFFIGWVSGWTSATIARVTYPPPKKAALRRPEVFLPGLSGELSSTLVRRAAPGALSPRACV